jgi:hypothetical protein
MKWVCKLQAFDFSRRGMPDHMYIVFKPAKHAEKSASSSSQEKARAQPKKEEDITRTATLIGKSKYGLVLRSTR